MLAKPPDNQIEDPDPQSGADNWYPTRTATPADRLQAECSDTSHPGVASVADYLAALPNKIKLNCEPGHYYLLNNYNPGFLANGQLDTTTSLRYRRGRTRALGTCCWRASVSFAWFGEGWNPAVAEPDSPNIVYCNICNPFNYQSKFMADATLRPQVGNRDLTDFEAAVHSGDLPAVSFVKPSGINRWASGVFEVGPCSKAFTRKILDTN